MHTILHPKYNTTKEANDSLWKIIRHLDALMLMERPNGKIAFGANQDIDFGYEREWDEKGKWIGDFLTAYYKDGTYKTTMSPEKFESMTAQGQADFLNLLTRKLILHPIQRREI